MNVRFGGALLALALAAPRLWSQSAPEDEILPVAQLRIEPAVLEVEPGSTAQFTATAYDTSGHAMPDVEVLFGANPTLLGEVDSTGRFRAAFSGEGLIVARAVRAPVIAVARVRVTPPPLAKLELDVPREITAGSYVPLRVVGRDAAGNLLPVPDVAWVWTGAGVEVDGDYLLARAPGVVKLTARARDVEGSTTVRVIASPARSVEISCVDCPPPPALPTFAAATKSIPGGADVPRPAPRPVDPDAPLRVQVGDAIRLQARAPGVRGVLSPRWWLEGEGALLDQNGNFVAQRAGRFVVMSQLGRASDRRVIEAVPRARRGIFRLVGRGAVANPRVSDLWVFTGADGRDYAYTGSIGGDQVKVWDVTDPANPVQTDSLVVDARVINDVNLNETNRLGVLTREGASNRRNGIMFFDASDPAHPRIISEYTETVTSGVHNAFFSGDYVYATNDGTSALHVISAKDPLHPVEVARWEVRPGWRNKYLHDVIVQDGLAYLSYWDDGLVILDVGNGVEGGSPENPAFVSQISYPEGNTHTAWRWKNYVFTGDEIFGGPPVTPEGGVPGGFLHVIDVTDLENPVEVAWYEVPGAGAHNLWMDEENEILYVSYYNAGVRALDVSGNLRGDLMRQGRELAYFLTAEPDPAKAARLNAPMNWGPQLHEGNVFATDMNSGLWVLRYEPLEASITP